MPACLSTTALRIRTKRAGLQMHSLQLPSFTQNKIFVSQQRASPTTGSPPKKPPVVISQLIAGVTDPKLTLPETEKARASGLLKGRSVFASSR